jgi:hypothetical protein
MENPAAGISFGVEREAIKVRQVIVVRREYFMGGVLVDKSYLVARRIKTRWKADISLLAKAVCEQSSGGFQVNSVAASVNI